MKIKACHHASIFHGLISEFVLSLLTRWDAQRIREKYHHDQLLKKYMMKEGSLPSQDKKKEKIESLAPKLNDCKSVL